MGLDLRKPDIIAQQLIMNSSFLQDMKPHSVRLHVLQAHSIIIII